ncbi:inositol polyphosphate kinase family protein [Actinospica sp. MGRD01-02]|uniref:Inositol polyphosphate kinase family protein n=1 Tax=Actinospica acidithermotolerans TaxID=2828514 RepID=A0A941E7R3_9ACTN|nr:inositol polyphosphate kinase family protein [Actinospica acidithermotolerans]MBR7827885.1 inositol polyphosphate kinase family protein [Actinospica acidithermotolerans]
MAGTRPLYWTVFGAGTMDPCFGDPDTTAQVVSYFNQVMTGLDELKAGLQSVLATATSSGFVGKTADVLRNQIDSQSRLVNFLNQAQTAYSEAASALSAYYGVMVEQQQVSIDAYHQAVALNLPSTDPQVKHLWSIAKGAGETMQAAGNKAAGVIGSLYQTTASPISFGEKLLQDMGFLLIALGIVAVLFGGPIALLDYAVNLAVFIYGVVQFAEGKISFGELLLDLLNVLFPSTRGMIGDIVDGLELGTNAIKNAGETVVNLFRGDVSLDALFTNFSFATLLSTDVLSMAANAVKVGGLWVVDTLKAVPAFLGEELGGIKSLRLITPMSKEDLSDGLLSAIKTGILQRGLLISPEALANLGGLSERASAGVLNLAKVGGEGVATVFDSLRSAVAELVPGSAVSDAKLAVDAAGAVTKLDVAGQNVAGVAFHGLSAIDALQVVNPELRGASGADLFLAKVAGPQVEAVPVFDTSTGLQHGTIDLATGEPIGADGASSLATHLRTVPSSGYDGGSATAFPSIESLRTVVGSVGMPQFRVTLDGSVSAALHSTAALAEDSIFGIDHSAKFLSGVLPEIGAAIHTGPLSVVSNRVEPVVNVHDVTSSAAVSGHLEATANAFDVAGQAGIGGLAEVSATASLGHGVVLPPVGADHIVSVTGLGDLAQPVRVPSIDAHLADLSALQALDHASGSAFAAPVVSAHGDLSGVGEFGVAAVSHPIEVAGVGDLGTVASVPGHGDFAALGEAGDLVASAVRHDGDLPGLTSAGIDPAGIDSLGLAPARIDSVGSRVGVEFVDHGAAGTGYVTEHGTIEARPVPGHDVGDSVGISDLNMPSQGVADSASLSSRGLSEVTGLVDVGARADSGVKGLIDPDAARVPVPLAEHAAPVADHPFASDPDPAVKAKSPASGSDPVAIGHESATAGPGTTTFGHSGELAKELHEAAPKLSRADYQIQLTGELRAAKARFDTAWQRLRAEAGPGPGKLFSNKEKAKAWSVLKADLKQSFAERYTDPADGWARPVTVAGLSGPDDLRPYYRFSEQWTLSADARAAKFTGKFDYEAELALVHAKAEPQFRQAVALWGGTRAGRPGPDGNVVNEALSTFKKDVEKSFAEINGRPGEGWRPNGGQAVAFEPTLSGLTDGLPGWLDRYFLAQAKLESAEHRFWSAFELAITKNHEAAASPLFADAREGAQFAALKELADPNGIWKDLGAKLREEVEQQRMLHDDPAQLRRAIDTRVQDLLGSVEERVNRAIDLGKDLRSLRTAVDDLAGGDKGTGIRLTGKVVDQLFWKISDEEFRDAFGTMRGRTAVGIPTFRLLREAAGEFNSKLSLRIEHLAQEAHYSDVPAMDRLPMRELLTDLDKSFQKIKDLHPDLGEHTAVIHQAFSDLGQAIAARLQQAPVLAKALEGGRVGAPSGTLADALSGGGRPILAKEVKQMVAADFEKILESDSGASQDPAASGKGLPGAQSTAAMPPAQARALVKGELLKVVDEHLASAAPSWNALHDDLVQALGQARETHPGSGISDLALKRFDDAAGRLQDRFHDAVSLADGLAAARVDALRLDPGGHGLGLGSVTRVVAERVDALARGDFRAINGSGQGFDMLHLDNALTRKADVAADDPGAAALDPKAAEHGRAGAATDTTYAEEPVAHLATPLMRDAVEHFEISMSRRVTDYSLLLHDGGALGERFWAEFGRTVRSDLTRAVDHAVQAHPEAGTDLVELVKDRLADAFDQVHIQESRFATPTSEQDGLQSLGEVFAAQPDQVAASLRAMISGDFESVARGIGHASGSAPEGFGTLSREIVGKLEGAVGKHLEQHPELFGDVVHDQAAVKQAWTELKAVAQKIVDDAQHADLGALDPKIGVEFGKTLDSVRFRLEDQFVPELPETAAFTHRDAALNPGGRPTAEQFGRLLRDKIAEVQTELANTEWAIRAQVHAETVPLLHEVLATKFNGAVNQRFADRAALGLRSEASSLDGAGPHANDPDSFIVHTDDTGAAFTPKPGADISRTTLAEVRGWFADEALGIYADHLTALHGLRAADRLGDASLGELDRGLTRALDGLGSELDAKLEHAAALDRGLLDLRAAFEDAHANWNALFRGDKALSPEAVKRVWKQVDKDAREVFQFIHEPAPDSGWEGLWHKLGGVDAVWDRALRRLEDGFPSRLQVEEELLDALHDGAGQLHAIGSRHKVPAAPADALATDFRTELVTDYHQIFNPKSQYDIAAWLKHEAANENTFADKLRDLRNPHPVTSREQLAALWGKAFGDAPHTAELPHDGATASVGSSGDQHVRLPQAQQEVQAIGSAESRSGPDRPPLPVRDSLLDPADAGFAGAEPSRAHVAEAFADQHSGPARSDIGAGAPLPELSALAQSTISLEHATDSFEPGLPSRTTVPHPIDASSGFDFETDFAARMATVPLLQTLSPDQVTALRTSAADAWRAHLGRLETSIPHAPGEASSGETLPQNTASFYTDLMNTLPSRAMFLKHHTLLTPRPDFEADFAAKVAQTPALQELPTQKLEALKASAIRDWAKRFDNAESSAYVGSPKPTDPLQSPAIHSYRDSLNLLPARADYLERQSTFETRLLKDVATATAKWLESGLSPESTHAASIKFQAALRREFASAHASLLEHGAAPGDWLESKYPLLENNIDGWVGLEALAHTAVQRIDETAQWLRLSLSEQQYSAAHTTPTGPEPLEALVFQLSGEVAQATVSAQKSLLIASGSPVDAATRVRWFHEDMAERFDLVAEQWLTDAGDGAVVRAILPELRAAALGEPGWAAETDLAETAPSPASPLDALGDDWPRARFVRLEDLAPDEYGVTPYLPTSEGAVFVAGPYDAAADRMLVDGVWRTSREVARWITADGRRWRPVRPQPVVLIGGELGESSFPASVAGFLEESVGDGEHPLVIATSGHPVLTLAGDFVVPPVTRSSGHALAWPQEVGQGWDIHGANGERIALGWYLDDSLGLLGVEVRRGSVLPGTPIVWSHGPQTPTAMLHTATLLPALTRPVANSAAEVAALPEVWLAAQRAVVERSRPPMVLGHVPNIVRRARLHAAIRAVLVESAAFGKDAGDALAKELGPTGGAPDLGWLGGGGSRWTRQERGLLPGGVVGWSAASPPQRTIVDEYEMLDLSQPGPSGVTSSSSARDPAADEAADYFAPWRAPDSSHLGKGKAPETASARIEPATEPSRVAPWYVEADALGEFTVEEVNPEKNSVGDANAEARAIMEALGQREAIGKLSNGVRHAIEREIAGLLAERDGKKWAAHLRNGVHVEVPGHTVWLRPVLRGARHVPTEQRARRVYQVNFAGIKTQHTQQWASRNWLIGAAQATLNIASSALTAVAPVAPRVSLSSSRRHTASAALEVVSGLKAMSGGAENFAAAALVKVYLDGIELDHGREPVGELTVTFPQFLTPRLANPVDSTRPPAHRALPGRLKLRAQFLPTALDSGPVLADLQAKLLAAGVKAGLVAEISREIAEQMLSETSVRNRSRWLFTSGDVSDPIRVKSGPARFEGGLTIAAEIESLEPLDPAPLADVAGEPAPPPRVPFRSDMGLASTMKHAGGHGSAAKLDLASDVGGLGGAGHRAVGFLLGALSLGSERGYSSSITALAMNKTTLIRKAPFKRYRAVVRVTIKTDSTTHQVADAAASVHSELLVPLLEAAEFETKVLGAVVSPDLSGADAWARVRSSATVRALLAGAADEGVEPLREMERPAVLDNAGSLRDPERPAVLDARGPHSTPDDDPMPIATGRGQGFGMLLSLTGSERVYTDLRDVLHVRVAQMRAKKSRISVGNQAMGGGSARPIYRDDKAVKKTDWSQIHRDLSAKFGSPALEADLAVLLAGIEHTARIGGVTYDMAVIGHLLDRHEDGATSAFEMAVNARSTGGITTSVEKNRSVTQELTIAGAARVKLSSRVRLEAGDFAVTPGHTRIRGKGHVTGTKGYRRTETDGVVDASVRTIVYEVSMRVDGGQKETWYIHSGDLVGEDVVARIVVAPQHLASQTEAVPPAPTVTEGQSPAEQAAVRAERIGLVGRMLDFSTGAEGVYPAFLIVPELARAVSDAHADLNSLPHRPERWDWPEQIRRMSTPTALQAHFDALVSERGWVQPLPEVKGWKQAVAYRLRFVNGRLLKSSAGDVEIEHYGQAMDHLDGTAGREWGVELSAAGGLVVEFGGGEGSGGHEPTSTRRAGNQLSIRGAVNIDSRWGRERSAGRGQIRITRTTMAGVVHTVRGDAVLEVDVMRWKGDKEQVLSVNVKVPDGLDLLVPHRRAEDLGLQVPPEAAPDVPRPQPGLRRVPVDQELAFGAAHVEALDADQVGREILGVLRRRGVLSPLGTIPGGRPNGLQRWVEDQFSSRELKKEILRLRQGMIRWRPLPAVFGGTRHLWIKVTADVGRITGQRARLETKLTLRHEDYALSGEGRSQGLDSDIAIRLQGHGAIADTGLAGGDVEVGYKQESEVSHGTDTSSKDIFRLGASDGSEEFEHEVTYKIEIGVTPEPPEFLRWPQVGYKKSVLGVGNLGAAMLGWRDAMERFWYGHRPWAWFETVTTRPAGGGAEALGGEAAEPRPITGSVRLVVPGHLTELVPDGPAAARTVAPSAFGINPRWAEPGRRGAIPDEALERFAKVVYPVITPAGLAAERWAPLTTVAIRHRPADLEAPGAWQVPSFGFGRPSALNVNHFSMLNSGIERLLLHTYHMPLRDIPVREAGAPGLPGDKHDIVLGLDIVDVRPVTRGEVPISASFKTRRYAQQGTEPKKSIKRGSGWFASAAMTGGASAGDTLAEGDLGVGRGAMHFEIEGTEPGEVAERDEEERTDFRYYRADVVLVIRGSRGTLRVGVPDGLYFALRAEDGDWAEGQLPDVFRSLGGQAPLDERVEALRPADDRLVSEQQVAAPVGASGRRYEPKLSSIPEEDETVGESPNARFDLAPGAPPRAPLPGRHAADSGGHGGIQKRVDGQVLEKETNAVEVGFYTMVRQLPEGHPLKLVVPHSYEADDVARMEGREPEPPTSGSRIFIDDLTYGMREPTLLDVKIGSRTASRHELLRHLSASTAWLKKNKLKLADQVTGSSSRGYRVVGGTGLEGSRREIGRDSVAHMRTYVEEGSVEALAGLLRDRILAIGAAAEKSGYAFVAASVLMAVDRQPTDASRAVDVKLIDFAHTFRPGDPGTDLDQYAKYAANFRDGINALVDDLSEIAAGRAGA